MAALEQRQLLGGLNSIVGAGSAVGGVLGTAVQGAGAGASSLAGLDTALTGVAGGLNTVAKASGLNTVVDDTGSALTSIVGGINSGVQNAGAAVTNGIGDGIASGLGQITSGLGDITSTLGSGVSSIVSGVTSILSPVLTTGAASTTTTSATTLATSNTSSLSSSASSSTATSTSTASFITGAFSDNSAPQQTVTNIVSITSAAAPSETVKPNSTSFLENKPLAGAVFGLAGLICLVLIFVGVTYWLRSRRRKRLYDDAVSFEPSEPHYADSYTDKGRNSIGSYRSYPVTVPANPVYYPSQQYPTYAATGHQTVPPYAQAAAVDHRMEGRALIRVV